MMARRPRAPDFRAWAFSAMRRIAVSVKRSFTFSNLRSFWYCLTRAFLGSVSTWMRSSTPSGSITATTGRRPMNSGMSPNLSRSSVLTCLSRPRRCSMLSGSVRPSIGCSRANPTDRRPMRCSMMRSRPSKLPPTMNRMFFVSICTCSWLGSRLLPRTWMLATVPSRILSSACCTPSPDTSRLTEDVKLFLESLSISSM